MSDEPGRRRPPPDPPEPRDEIRHAARAFLWLMRLSDPRPAIPFMAMPAIVRIHLVERLALGPDDHVLDLGCGDGATLIDLATRSGCRGTGLERDPARLAEARAAVTQAGVEPGRITLIEGDFEDEASLDRLPWAGITVALMFLYPWAVGLLVPRLAERLSPEARVVSYTFADTHFAEGRREMVPGFAYPGHRVPLYVWPVAELRDAARVGAAEPA